MNMQKAPEYFSQYNPYCFCLIYGDKVVLTASLHFVMERLILKLTSRQAILFVYSEEV